MGKTDKVVELKFSGKHAFRNADFSRLLTSQISKGLHYRSISGHADTHLLKGHYTDINKAMTTLHRLNIPVSIKVAKPYQWEGW